MVMFLLLFPPLYTVISQCQALVPLCLVERQDEVINVLSREKRVVVFWRADDDDDKSLLFTRGPPLLQGQWQEARKLHETTVRLSAQGSDEPEIRKDIQSKPETQLVSDGEPESSCRPRMIRTRSFFK